MIYNITLKVADNLLSFHQRLFPPIITPMQDIAKFFILLGVLFFSVGLLLWVFGKFLPFLGHLPGDIEIKRDNFSLYIPLGSSLFISLILTLVLNLILWLVNRN